MPESMPNKIPRSIKHFLSNEKRFLNAGFWYWDSESNKIHVSKKVLKTLGIANESDEFEFNTLLGIVYKTDKDKLKRAFNRLKKGFSLQREVDFRVKEGKGWQWVKIIALTDEVVSEGKRYIIGQFKSIDVGKYTSSEYDFLEAMSFATFRYNPVDEVISWQTSVPDDFSSSDEFWNIDDFKKYLGEETFKSLRSNLQVFINQSNSKELAINFNYRSIPYKLSFAKVRDSSFLQGVLYRYIEAENDESINIQKFSKILNRHQVAFLEIDTNDNIVGWNGYAAKIFGFEKSPCQISALKKFFSDSEWSKFYDWAKGETTKQLTTSFKRENDDELILLWKKVIDDANERESTIFAARDITGQAKLQGRVKELENSLGRLKAYSLKIQKLTTGSDVLKAFNEEIKQLYPKAISVVFSYNDDDNFLTIVDISGVNEKSYKVIVDELGWNPIGRRLFFDSENLRSLLPSNTKELTIPINEVLDGIVSVVSYKNLERIFGVEKTFGVGFIKDDRVYGGTLIIKSQNSKEIYTDVVDEYAVLTSSHLAITNQINELKAKIDTLKSKISEQYDLITHISHSVRTPLNSILGFSSLFELTEIDKTQRKDFIKIIQEQSNEILEQMNQFQDYVRVANHSISIIKANQCINDLLVELQDAAKSSCSLVRSNAVTVTFSKPENSDFLEIYTDSGRIIQAFVIYINYLSKIIQAGSIDFRYSIVEGKVIFSISEVESAIDLSVREQIIEALKGVVSEEVRNIDYFNVILANRIFDLLGGDIHISEENEKIKVEVAFDLNVKVDESFEDNEEEQETTTSVDYKNNIILIVEDEEVNYLILKELVHSWGASSLWAKNGKEAVELVSSLNKSIDLILMDIRMPVMDGYAATMEIKQINPNIPVVAQTAYSAPEERLKAQAAGCNGYITKPIDPKALLNVIEIFLG
jgi:CheY-like chemotaxis protein/PAS domain-containing protein